MVPGPIHRFHSAGLGWTYNSVVARGHLRTGRKLLESWWIWILADLVYIPLYIYKGLVLTSVLYFVFLLLCIFGLRQWRAVAAS